MPLTVPPSGSRRIASSTLVLVFLLPVTPSLAAVVKMNDVAHGSLLLRGAATDDPQARIEAPLLESRFEVTVTGLVVRTEVRQRFHNPTSGFVEGTYVFPLSDTAAVDTMRVVVGPRILEGRIEERKAAARIYEDAKRDGKIASLVEQVRPNLFTTSVANIPADADVEVVIGYQDTLPVEAGRVALRLPLAVTPRYTPAQTAAGTQAVVDDKGMTFAQDAGPVFVDVTVDAGFPVARIASRSHPIDTTRDGERAFHVNLAGGRGKLDRDFVLEWDARPLTAPSTAVVTERFGDAEYGLLVVSPPTVAAEAARVPSDITFILDTSGSMSGQSMDSAVRALSLAVEKIDPRDRFNVIEFDDDTHALFEGLTPATLENKSEALQAIGGYVADGGTEMRGALELALRSTDGEARRVHRIIFITDGAVSNEEELFALIRDHLGKARLFTVGIGAAPNAFFMRKAAEMGRGTFTFIGNPTDVEPRMAELFDKLDTPVLTNLELAFGPEMGTDIEVWPRRLPDLFAGEPLMVVFKSSKKPSSVVLSGMAAGAPMALTVSMSDPRTSTRERGVHKLWARRKVDSLTDALNTSAHGGEPTTLEADILATALTHRIVSQFTSLVAVDVTPVRQGEPLQKMDVPTALPEGQLPRGGTEGPLLLLVGAALLVLALALARQQAHPGDGARA